MTYPSHYLIISRRVFSPIKCVGKLFFKNEWSFNNDLKHGEKNDYHKKNYEFRG